MNNTLIYIGDELLQLLPDTVVAITFKSFDVGNIKSRNISYTNRIKVAKTPENLRIIGREAGVNSTSTKVYSKLQCKVVQDGIELPNLTSLLVDDISDYIYFVIYTSELGIFDVLNDYCSDLDFGIEEILDQDFIEDFSDGSSPVVSGFIDHGRVSQPDILPTAQENEFWVHKDLVTRPPCRVATTGNITLSGLQTVNGVSLVAGDRVLVRAQSSAAQNGIYIVQSGTWLRADDLLRAEQFIEAKVTINSGSTLAGTAWLQIADVATVDTSTVTWLQVTQGNSSWVNITTPGELVLTNANSRYYTSEFELIDIISYHSSNAYNVEIGFEVSSAGSPDVVIRAYLEDEDGIRLLIAENNATSDGFHSLNTGGYTLQLDRTYKKLVLFAFRQNSDNTTTINIGPSNTINALIQWRQQIEFNYYLPQIKYHYTIEKILERLGTYVLEYPDDNTDFYENLLLTYSREYYGYRDSSISIDDGDLINMSKFILPDIPQKQLLTDWLIRTFSLFRVKDGIIEVKPVYNIIRDKEINAIDWTNKRDISAVESNRFFLSSYAQENYFEDGDTKDEFSELIKKGIPLLSPSQSRYSFSIANDALPGEKTTYTSIFNASQHIPWSGTIEMVRTPIYDIFSENRKDFKNSPLLRILYAEDLGLGSAYYGDTLVFSYLRPAYKDDDDHNIWSHFATWDHFIELGYSNFVESLQSLQIVRRKYRLSLLDIANLDLFKPIYDDGSYYIVNQIGEFINGKSTTVELIKI